MNTGRGHQDASHQASACSAAAPSPGAAAPPGPVLLPTSIGGLRIVRVLPHQRQIAAERIVGSAAEEHGSVAAAARRFLESAASLNIDVSLMWGTIDPSGRFFHHVCLAVVGAGRTAMLFFSGPDPSPRAAGHVRSDPGRGADPAFFGLNANFGPDNGHDNASPSPALEHPDVPSHILQQEALVRHACRHLREMKSPPVSRGVSGDGSPVPRRDPSDSRVVALVQGLLEPHETDAATALARAGFIRLGDLAYMRRSLPRARGFDRGRSSRTSRAGRHAEFGESFVWPAGVTVTRVSDVSPGDRDALLAAALERSYIDTQDCPELCGLRDVADVLDSHKSVGDYDPSLWWIINYQGNPEGAMLLSACPEQQTIELVYLGISPTLRGKGIGSAMLALGLKELTGRPESTISCAVDTRNLPALKLYTRAGFQEFSLRVPMVMGIR